MKQEEKERFEEWAAEAIALLPEHLRSRLENVRIVIASGNDAQSADHQSGGSRNLMLGLYHGIPQPKRRVYQPYQFPDTITIYAGTIRKLARSEADRRSFVIDTVLHEVGHYFGLSEGELRELRAYPHRRH